VFEHRGIEIRHGRINAGCRIRKLSEARVIVRHDAHVGHGQRLPKGFVISEEKQLVLFERSTERAAKLIAAERGHGTLIKEVPGVKHAVADKFENCPVDRISAGPRHELNLCAGALSILRAVGIAENIDLTNAIDAQQLTARAARRYRKL